MILSWASAESGFTFWERGVIDGVTMVLWRDVALSCEPVENRLVLPAVPKGHFDGLCASGEGQELVAEADAKNGPHSVPLQSKHLSKLLDGGAAEVRVAGTVGEEEPVEVAYHAAKWVIPWHHRHLPEPHGVTFR